MNYKRLIPCIFVKGERMTDWFGDGKLLPGDPAELAKAYSDGGADELLLFDVSDTGEQHEAAIGLLRRMNRVIEIPVTAGGNIRRLEDVKKILYAGAKRAMVNLALPGGASLIENASKRFGKEKIGVCLEDFDMLFKHQRVICGCCRELVFMRMPDLDSVGNITDIPCVIVTDTAKEEELFQILENPEVKGVSGKLISQRDTSIFAFKEKCVQRGIRMTSFESSMEFRDFKTDEKGLLPVIVQHYRTQDVLMLAYMNEEAFYKTIRTGKMTYFSRSRQKLWVKGETSGHFQYVKSLTVDCDCDTLLAKVEQIGPACHTGNPTCFYQRIAGAEHTQRNPLRIFETVYDTIIDRRDNPKEGSYTNYLFEKGIDKILKKVGEEATEIVIAAKNPNPEEMKYEMADFLYHAMVLMVEKGLKWEDITRELAER